MPFHFGVADDPVAPERRVADALQQQVEPDREGGHRALAEPVVGDVAQPRVLALAHAQPLDRLAVEHDAACIGGALAGDRLGKLFLAVAVHARDPEDFPFTYREAHSAIAGRCRAASRAEAVHLDRHTFARRGLPPCAAPFRHSSRRPQRRT